MPKTVNFNPASDYDLEAANIERRRKMAEALAVEAGRFPDQTQVINGVAVKQSPLIGAAKLAQALMAHKSLKEADQKQQDLMQRIQQDRMSTLSDFQNLMQGQPGSYEQLPPGVFGPEQELQAPTPANPKAAMMRLMQSGDPMMRQMGMQNVMAQMMPQKPVVVGRTLMTPEGKVVGVDSTWQAEEKAKREERSQLEAEKRQARREEIEMRLQDQAISRAENAALRREMVGIASADRRFMAEQGGKPPAGYRFTKDGNMEAIPGGPADAKAQATAQRQADGATDVDVAITSLRDAYDRLEKGGGITSTEKNPLSNAGAALSSSGIGQVAGKAFGTKNQSARNDIAMARPALLAALMKATGMSAKQMDSNAELKLWLSTATDPTLDVESNRRALQNIEKKYLKGGSNSDEPPPGAVRRKN